MKVYSRFGHRSWESELHSDLDGDGVIDRIRRNGSELKGNSQLGILIRKYDYEGNEKRFDKADSRLKKLMEKYGSVED